MKARLLALCVLAALLAAACDEDPPVTGYDTETPFESPSPAITPVVVNIPTAPAIETKSGQISLPGERDQFIFTLANGDDIRVDVDAQGAGANFLDAVLTLYAPNGTVAAIADDGTNNWEPGMIAPGALRDPYLLYEATAPGIYTLVIEDASGAGDDDPDFDYSIVFSRAAPTLLEGGVACGSAVLLPPLTDSVSVLSVNGSINPVTSTDSCCDTQVLPCVGAPVSGKDVIYKASLTSGSRVQITRTGSAFDGAVYATTGCAGSIASIRDTCMAGADSGNATEGFVFTPTITGDYYVFVDGVTNAGGTTGSGGAFTLDLRLLP